MVIGNSVIAMTSRDHIGPAFGGHDWNIDTSENLSGENSAH
jgi:hypothetical protein